LVGVPTLSVQKIQNYVSIKLLKPSLRLPRRSLKYEFMEISPRRLVRKDGLTCSRHFDPPEVEGSL
jgi:hypothetical protein